MIFLSKDGYRIQYGRGEKTNLHHHSPDELYISEIDIKGGESQRKAQDQDELTDHEHRKVSHGPTWLHSEENHECNEYYKLKSGHHQRSDAGRYHQNIAGEEYLLNQAGLSDHSPDALGCASIQEVPEHYAQEQEELIVLYLDAHKVAEYYIKNHQH